MRFDIDLSASFSALYCIIMLMCVCAIGMMTEKILNRLDAMDEHIKGATSAISKA